ncbi:MAG: TraB/GumN family protein [Ferruginibacter sp.]
MESNRRITGSWVAFVVFLGVILHGCGTPRKQSTQTSTVQDGKSLLWEISKPGVSHKSYLFGTFHLLCRKDIQFSENLLQGLADSKTLYLELDLEDPSNAVALLKGMKMRGDTSMADLLSQQQYNALSRFFEDSVHMGLSMVKQMKPALLSAMIYPSMMPCKSVVGMEQLLMAEAKERTIPVKGLETIADQTAVFDQIPYKTQAMELIHMIDSIVQYKGYFNDMLATYLKQDLNAIEASFSKEPGFDQQRPFLLDNRNKNWVNSLKNVLPKQPVFIAVGAGHLPGKMGLIDLLRQEGYTVRAIDNTRKPAK